MRRYERENMACTDQYSANGSLSSPQARGNAVGKLALEGMYGQYHYQLLADREGESVTVWAAVIDLDGDVIGVLHGRIHPLRQPDDAEMHLMLGESVELAIEDSLITGIWPGNV